MGIKNWIFFNGTMINKNHVIFLKKNHEYNVIEIGCIYYSFNKKFATEEELEAEYEILAEELGID